MTTSPTIPGYRTLQRLGAGAYAEVWKVEHNELGELRAAKVLHPREVLEAGSSLGTSSEGYERAAERFLEEGRKLTRLADPHVVRFFDYCRTASGRPCLILEYCPETLSSHLGDVEADGEGTGAWGGGRRQLEPNAAADIARQVALGLAYLHSQDVIHRDVKPSNVLCGSDGLWKLGDFGLAKALGLPTATHSVAVGTILYMAPEQRRSEAVPQSDLFAVGVLLHRMLTGNEPAGLLDMDSLGNIPRPLVELIERLLQPSAEKRIQTADEVVDLLKSDAPPSPPRPSNSKRPLLVLGGILVLALALFFVAIGREKGDSSRFDATTRSLAGAEDEFNSETRGGQTTVEPGAGHEQPADLAGSQASRESPAGTVRDGWFESEAFNIRFVMPDHWHRNERVGDEESIVIEGPDQLMLIVATTHSLQLDSAGLSQPSERVRLDQINMIPDRTEARSINGILAYSVEGDAVLRRGNTPVYFVAQALACPGGPTMLVVVAPSDSFDRHASEIRDVLASAEWLSSR